MKNVAKNNTCMLACGLLGLAKGAALLLAGLAVAQAHVTLDQPKAVAGSTYKAVFKVGHACEGARATTGLTIRLPAGFAGAQPMPKAGWQVTVRRAPLAKPYDSHGKTITEDVVEVRYQARSADDALPAELYDEVTVRGRLPDAAGPLWFKVLQSCDRGEADWADVPAQGSSLKGLKAPAALLEVTPAAASHEHHH